MTMIPRLATPQDANALSALFARSYPVLLARDYPPEVLNPALPLMCRAQPMLLASGRFHVIDGPDGPLAAGGWSVERPGTQNREPGLGHIRHVVCDPAVTRRGFAAAILRAVMDQARRAGIARLECWSTRTAVPFYAAQGFAAVRPRDVVFPGGVVFPSVEMTRDI